MTGSADKEGCDGLLDPADTGRRIRHPSGLGEYTLRHTASAASSSYIENVTSMDTVVV